MKYTPFLFAAVLPFSAAAEQAGSSDIKVDAEKLRHATPATMLLDEDIKTNDGRDAGSLEEIVISSDGKVQHFLLDADKSDLQEEEQEQRQQVSAESDSDQQDMDLVADERSEDVDADDPVYETRTADQAGDEESDSELVAEERGGAASEEPVYESESRSAEQSEASMDDSETEPVYEREESRSVAEDDQDSGGWMGDDELVRVSADSLSYDNESKTISVDSQKIMSAQQVSEDSAAQGGDEIKVSELVGMDVHLSDEDSFGSVEDVMLSEDHSEIVAIVVDNWDGLSKERRALPMEGAQIDSENDAVSYQYSLSDVQGLPEFNLDRYTDDEGWDLTDW